ncbi:MAG: galactose mutarotase [Clostridia bacterium]|nr:galactose mutarotase [Clostridia bacterium]
MKIKVTPFGRAYGKQAFKYEMTTDKGASCVITDLAGAVIAVRVPDKKGIVENVVLGFDDPKQYIKNPGYLGALIGPVGNRIAGASFKFEKKEYRFEPNEGGTTLLHSGDFGFHACVWDSEIQADAGKAVLTLKHVFLNRDTGFPGDLRVTVKYTFDEGNTLRIDYEAESDEPSFLSPTNHTYFNIAGLGSRRVPKVDRQTVQIFADRYTEVKDGSIPTKAAKVEGAPFDLRQPKKLADGFACEKENAQMILGAGYDHNYILSEPVDLTGLRPAARVCDRLSGRVMDVYTDMPCVQLYTANHLRRFNAQEKRGYGKRRALCLETQCAPDSIHHAGEDGFQLMKVEKDKPFRSSTVYAFSVKK